MIISVIFRFQSYGYTLATPFAYYRVVWTVRRSVAGTTVLAVLGVTIAPTSKTENPSHPSYRW